MPPPSVMILGCGRSGTSIFGELFDHLTMYDYVSEPLFSNVMKANFDSPLAYKVPRESSSFKADPGLSLPLADMQRRAPRMKYFWVVRHPLDAICSLRVGIGQNWGHHPRPPDWQAWVDRPIIEQCAHHWAFLNTSGFGQVSEIASVIQFEDMIAEPHVIAKNTCNTLGIDPSENSVSLGEWSRRVQDTNNSQFIEAETSKAYSRPDHSVRVGRWRENLSTAEIKSILPIVTAVGKIFGYNFPAI